MTIIGSFARRVVAFVTLVCSTTVFVSGLFFCVDAFIPKSKAVEEWPELMIGLSCLIIGYCLHRVYVSLGRTKAER